MDHLNRLTMQCTQWHPLSEKTGILPINDLKKKNKSLKHQKLTQNHSIGESKIQF